ncbi:unnamed protein product [Caenorhabditis brenneri]
MRVEALDLQWEKTCFRTLPINRRDFGALYQSVKSVKKTVKIETPKKHESFSIGDKNKFNRTMRMEGNRTPVATSIRGRRWLEKSGTCGSLSSRCCSVAGASGTRIRATSEAPLVDASVDAYTTIGDQDAAKDPPTGIDPAELKDVVGAHGGRRETPMATSIKMSSMSRKERHQRNQQPIETNPRPGEKQNPKECDIVEIKV